MTNTTQKRILGTLVLVAVAGLSYAAGAAKGKQAVNMPASEIKWEPMMPGAPLQMAKLWGDRAKGGDYGMLLKMPGGGFEAGMHSHTADYHALSVQGTWVHTNQGDPASAKEMGPGSYVMQPGKQVHNDMCKGPSECILFIHQHAKGDFIPAKVAEAPKGAAPTPAAAAAPAAHGPAMAPVPAPSAPAKAPAAMPAAPGAAAPTKK